MSTSKLTIYGEPHQFRMNRLELDELIGKI